MLSCHHSAGRRAGLLKAVIFKSLLAVQHGNKVIRATQQEKMHYYRNSRKAELTLVWGSRCHGGNETHAGLKKMSTVKNELCVLYICEQRYGVAN